MLAELEARVNGKIALGLGRDEWITLGCVVQVTMASLTGAFGI